MIRVLLLGAGAALATACATTGQQQVAQTKAPLVDRVSETNGDPDEVICKEVDVSGSRLNKAKQCKTREQWNDTFNSFRAVGDMQNAATANGASQ